MAATGGNTTRAKVAKLRKAALDLIGRKCIWCGTRKELQCAHVLPTDLLQHRHRRAGWRRWNDIAKNPQCYRPMCPKHHQLFDRLTRDLVQSAKGVVEEPIPF